MAQLTFAFLGGRAKCAGRELGVLRSFSQMSRLRILFLPGLVLTVIISMFSFSSLKAGIVHFCHTYSCFMMLFTNDNRILVKKIIYLSSFQYKTVQ